MNTYSSANQYVFIRQPIRIHRSMNTYSQANQYVLVKQTNTYWL